MRVEYYASSDAKQADMSDLLEDRTAYFAANEQQNWATLVVGSLSSASVESRLREQFVVNPQFKDPRKWYGAATEYVERLIHFQKNLACNVIYITHIGKDKDEVGGEYLFTPDLPGRLSWSAGRWFNEIYRVFIQRDENGVAHRFVQTDGDGRYHCKTHIDADMYVRLGDMCSGYESLWKNWKGVVQGG